MTDWDRLSDLAEQLARAILAGETAEEFAARGAGVVGDMTEDDWATLLGLSRHWVEYLRAKERQGNRRAHALLRALLTDEQRGDLKRNRSFLVEGSEGGMYRLFPATGAVHRVERHGRFWYHVAHYCLHPDRAKLDDRDIPNADTTIGHLLMLQTDEHGFRDAANETASHPVAEWGVANAGWAPEWRRRLHAARLQDEAEEYDRIVRAELRAEGVDPDAFLAELQGQVA